MKVYFKILFIKKQIFLSISKKKVEISWSPCTCKKPIKNSFPSTRILQLYRKNILELCLVAWIFNDWILPISCAWKRARPWRVNYLYQLFCCRLSLTPIPLYQPSVPSLRPRGPGSFSAGPASIRLVPFIIKFRFRFFLFRPWSLSGVFW